MNMRRGKINCQSGNRVDEGKKLRKNRAYKERTKTDDRLIKETCLTEAIEERLNKREKRWRCFFQEEVSVRASRWNRKEKNQRTKKTQYVKTITPSHLHKRTFK